jgi:RNA-directed DNA polymerase
MSRLALRRADKGVLKLVRAYLQAGIMEGGLVRVPTEGTPHGGPLSPFLSNGVLDELDKELESRVHKKRLTPFPFFSFGMETEVC